MDFDDYLYQEITQPYFFLVDRTTFPSYQMDFGKFLRQAADEQDPDLDRLLEALLEVGGPTFMASKKKAGNIFLNFRFGPQLDRNPKRSPMPQLDPLSHQ